ncbi:LacI family DNA-binding transcriptional regulator [Microbacterium sp. SORGH_AS_0888]|uniref:LacI family DNA-binding transcriptional regulator n=1 Tax=Microbacterium sp. SORGH_AS_0888 TaxID=3041791 RepID=UPI0027849926|nr:LacI family DNA-binding transcriptional regulator [Microbacterium sp. SORGH_AS_0888]MDQ1129173.1 DNA-binding LacI/PurR family transcriptional regulator [Microbacterium sp. SORGH_AS_0888]
MSDAATGRRPSIRDVARLAGVSHQTVSRVINDHPSIRPETRERVLGVMAELRYRPSRAARALVTSRSQTLGILSASSTEYGPASAIAAIEAAARERGYWVGTVNVEPGDPDSITRAIAHLLAQSVEGLVVVAPQEQVARLLAAQRLDIPVVTLQNTAVDARQALFVDQVAGARRATAHLIELGHRRIAHLAGPGGWFEAEARIRGFGAELDAHGLTAAASVVGDWTAESGYRAGRELLRAGEATAVFSSNDQMALGVLHAAHEAGRDVPGELSVVGFDDIPEAAHFWPPLTTVRQDFAELGRRCVEVLLGPEGAAAAERAVMPELIVRASTTAPR